MLSISESSLQILESDFFNSHGVQVWIKRDDQIHQEVSGNKWRKLKYNVAQCQQMKNEGVLTFGGAYSNHLVATAAACNELKLKSVGVVRGDELNADSNATLKRCHELGMHLHFISRAEYGLRSERYYHEELLAEFPNMHIVPEGGANYLGMVGCQEIVNEIDESFDVIFLAQGTTTTSCGIALGLKDEQQLHVNPALKGYDALGEMRTLLGRSAISDELIDQLLSNTVVHDHHFGGYAKHTEELVEFVRNFYREFGIKLDPVYTGKAMFALYETIKSGSLKGKRVVFVHTGGVQGAASIMSFE